MNELEKSIDQQKKWNKEHPILSAITKIYYWGYRNLNPNDWYREVKYFLQRVFRGYSDRDIWGMNTYLGNHIIKCLKAFKKRNQKCYPIFPDGDELTDDENREKWNKILEDMIYGWEHISTDAYDTDLWKKCFEDKKISYSDYKKENEKIYIDAEQKAMLFIKYFDSLWD